MTEASTKDGAASLFCGREHELAELTRLWNDARAGFPASVLLAGPPGIGKSALIERFVTSLQDAAEQPSVGTPPLVAYATCTQGCGELDPYKPLLDAVGGLVDGPARPLVERLLAERAPAWQIQLPQVVPAGERARIERGLRGAGAGRMVREGMALLAALAAAQPVVLIVEDLHWADAPTLGLLATLASTRERLPLLVVGSYRAAHAALHEHLTTPLRALRRSATARLVLDPFHATEIRGYLERRLAPHPVTNALVETIEAASGGMPLAVGLFADRQLGLGSPLPAAEADQGSEIDPEIPRALQRVIEEQLGLLAAAQVQLLEDAAVCGMEFETELLAEALGVAEEVVVATCSELAGSRRFLRRAAGVRFGFRHAIHRIVVVERIEPSRRAELNRRIGETLARMHAGDTRPVAARLAQHFGSAGEAREAATFLEQSAANALARLAYREAASLVEQAVERLQVLPPSRERDLREAHLQILLGNLRAAFTIYGIGGTEDAFERAAALYGRAGAGREVFRARMGLLMSRLLRAHCVGAEDLGMVLVSSTRGELASLEAVALAYLGAVRMTMGQLGDAVRHLERSATLQADPGVPVMMDAERMAATFSGIALTLCGRLTDANAAFARGAARIRVAGGHLDQADALVHALAACGIRRDAEEAARLADELAALAEAHDLAAYLRSAHFYKAWAHACTTADPAAAHSLEHAAHALDDFGIGWMRSMRLALEAELRLATGDANGAAECVERGIAHVEGTDERFYEAELHRLYAEALLATAARIPERSSAAVQAATEESTRWLHRAVDIARAQGAALFELRAATALVRLSDTPSTRALIREALTHVAPGESLPEAEQARALL